MKKILLFIVFLTSGIWSYAQDTIELRQNRLLKDQIIIPKTTCPLVDTAAIVRLKCGVPISIDTLKKFGRILYIGSTEYLAAIRNPSTAGQELKWYLQDYKYTGTSYYGLGSTSTSDWPAMRAFNKDLRVNYGIAYIEATGGSLSSLQARIAFNNSCIDAREKFDAYNNEDEYWNADPNNDKVHSDAEVLAAWKADSAAMIPMRAACDQAGIAFVWYHGWPIKNVIPLHMEKKLSKFQYHIYNAGSLNVNYGDWRWADANKAAQMDNTLVKKSSVIISSESAFSGPWLATHTLDEVDNMLKAKIAQYPNLQLTDVQVFMYSKIKQYQKPKRLVPSTSLARMIPQPPDTTTAKSHLETAVER